jgi:Fructose-2,6-bisphosphatase
MTLAPKTTTVYMTRHGQTEWNVEHRLQGHRDSPLTALGIRQAEWLEEALRGVKLDLIATSSSPRAVHTAHLIKGNRDVPLIESEQLKEISLGIWEGRKQDEIKQENPQQFHHFWNDPGQFRVEGSETYREVSSRAVSFLHELLQRYEGQTILLVTHTVVFKLLMAYCEQRPLEQLWELPYIYPACLSKLEFEDGAPRIVMHADTSHYKEQPAES